MTGLSTLRKTQGFQLFEKLRAFGFIEAGDLKQYLSIQDHQPKLKTCNINGIPELIGYNKAVNSEWERGCQGWPKKKESIEIFRSTSTSKP
jgi:hypothetical protein